MKQLSETRIDLNRAWHSPGPRFQPERKIGIGRRFAAGAVKAANLLSAPFALSQTLMRMELLQRRLVLSGQLAPEEAYTTREFFRAFANDRARELTKKAKVYSYVEGILRHHPDLASIDICDILAKCHQLIAIIFSRLTVISEQPEYLYPVVASMSRGAARPEAIWFPEYQAAYRAYKNYNKLPQRDALLSPYFVGESLADIGCGGGDQVAYCGAHHPELTRVAGFDVVDWRTPGLTIDYHKVDFSKPGEVAPAQYDTGLILAVLHHVARPDQTEKLDTFLQGVRTAVRRRLIVEEDVIVPSKELENVAAVHNLNWGSGNPWLDRAVAERHGEYHQQLSEAVGLRSAGLARAIPGMRGCMALADQPLLDEYVSLDLQSQRDFTILNDYLANALSVGVPEMPFPFGFHTVTDWLEIFSRNGFILNKLNILGFQPGNFNQACHVHFVLDKT